MRIGCLARQNHVKLRHVKVYFLVKDAQSTEAGADNKKDDADATERKDK